MGEYSVFGIIAGISLFNPEVLDELINALSDAEKYRLKELGIQVEIKGPAIHMIPIAIFT
jgi:hypothetical protein